MKGSVLLVGLFVVLAVGALVWLGDATTLAHEQAQLDDVGDAPPRRNNGSSGSVVPPSGKSQVALAAERRLRQWLAEGSGKRDDGRRAAASESGSAAASDGAATAVAGASAGEMSGAPTLVDGRMFDRALRQLNESAPLRVLVTGGAGFIGFHTCLALRRAGHAVVALDSFTGFYDVRLQRARAALLASERVPLVNASVCDEARLAALFAEHRFTRVLHLAANAGVRSSLMHPLTFVENNVRCFTSLLELLRQHAPHVPLVYASSSSVYGKNRKTPFVETDPVTQPVSPYAATKRANELLAHVYHSVYGLRTIGLRFFTVYGPYGRPDMAYFSFSEAMLAQRPIPIYNHGRVSRDFTYVDDIVSGVCAALRRAELFQFEVFNLGNSHCHSVLDLVDALEDSLGVTAKRNFTEQAKGDVLTTYANIGKAGRYLNYAPKTSLRDGIASFAVWFKEWKREHP